MWYLKLVVAYDVDKVKANTFLNFHLKLQSSELNGLIDYSALHMQQILTTTVAQCTAGLSPLIDPVVRLLVTSEMKAELNSTKHKYVS